jgi:hypothetical protein
MCGADFEVPIPEDAQEGALIPAWCAECDYDTKVRLKDSNLEEVDDNET